jgi:hypothetical protein
MKGYELSPEATDDLQEIWVYITNDNPAAADKPLRSHQSRSAWNSSTLDGFPMASHENP